MRCNDGGECVHVAYFPNLNMNSRQKKRKYEVWTGKYISWRDAVHTPEEDSENFDQILKKEEKKRILIK